MVAELEAAGVEAALLDYRANVEIVAASTGKKNGNYSITLTMSSMRLANCRLIARLPVPGSSAPWL